MSFALLLKREVATQLQNFSSSFSTQFSPSLCHLGILPSYLGKALGLPSLLACGYFHNRISVLSVPLHKMVLYGQRQDMPIGANKL